LGHQMPLTNRSPKFLDWATKGFGAVEKGSQRTQFFDRDPPIFQKCEDHPSLSPQLSFFFSAPPRVPISFSGFLQVKIGFFFFFLFRCHSGLLFFPTYGPTSFSSDRVPCLFISLLGFQGTCPGLQPFLLHLCFPSFFLNLDSALTFHIRFVISFY